MSLLRILYPYHPLNEKEADGPYQAEYLAAQAAGLQCALFNFDTLDCDEFQPRPAIVSGEHVLYRGWMLRPESYALLTKFIQRDGGTPVTSVADYSQCHHLPGWYDTCAELTADTRFFAADDDVVAAAEALNWPGYFVKDYVKSNTGDRGSIAYSPAEIPEILAQLVLYRGEIEGGIALRRLEDYVSESECRYFVVAGEAYGPEETIPALVKTVAERIEAPFYSVDVVLNTEGNLRLVELGDGQVSGIKDWPIEKFITVLQAIARL